MSGQWALVVSLTWIAALTAGGVLGPWAWAVVVAGLAFGLWTAKPGGE